VGPIVRGNPVVVIGLGRFGSSIADELQRHGREVLAIDLDRQLVSNAANRLTAAVEADATDEAALRQLGVHEMREAVVAIGQDREASILVTALLSELGVGRIWAKALSEAHGRILERVGATRVVFPEAEMGRIVANDFLTDDIVQLRDL
jgi:trk system potassium uptake protein